MCKREISYRNIVVMYITSHYLLSVICLTIVTTTRSLPTKNVSDEMSGALSCAFLRKYASDTKRYCSQVDLDHYDDKFHRIYYACMELYDVSLQLCNMGRKDANSDFGTVPKATDFCKDLKFYDKRVESTEPWASIAVKFLSSPANCDKVCISENSIHPICEAIYLGNKFLIKAAEDQPDSLRKPVAHADVSVTTHSQSNPTTPDIQSILHRDQPRLDKDLTISVTPEKPKDSKEERKSIPVNQVAVESQGKNIPGVRIADSVGKSNDLTRIVTDKKDDLENIRSEDALPTAEDKLVEAKHVDEAQSFVSEQQFSEPIDNGPQNVEQQLPGGSQSLAPAVAVPAVTPSVNPEPFYKDSADDREDIRDSSKDGEMENEGIGDMSFKEETGSSILTQEDGPNIDASGEPEENLGITGNKYSSRFPHAQDSHFFAYFLTMVVICIIGYLVFHNKQKIIALALEGRRMQGSRRRPNTSSYKKLDSNLEEAVTSNCSSSSVTHVIF
ncbi:hypothetical protein J437_LFUL017502 [Ladona fulva]|uniref:Uncharacterized protein n=1 Tax=Ladona fulva TaxID=123851 RepID=A0A8K0KLX7_LADFU|nr:hypothetical protein J437_LFUL017502 [Ladona fulva]